MDSTFDPISLVEQAYVPRSGLSSWLKGMAEPLAAAIDPDRMGLLCYFHEEGRCYGSLPEWLPGEHTPFRDREEAIAYGGEVYAYMTPEDRHRIAAGLRHWGLQTMRSGLQPESPVLDRLGIRDAAALIIPGPQGQPFMLTSLMRAPIACDRAWAGIWRRLVAHLGAGLRLCTGAGSIDDEDVECVLEPNGRVVDARAAVQSSAAQNQLREAVRAVDRARTRRARSNPAEALEMWQGLFAGRWSIVDHFDSDGRRFVLARRNTPDVGCPQPLPLRQRQVLFFVSAGWSNKEVAYALGITTSTVAVHLQRALANIGVRSREEWIRLSAAAMAA